MSKAIKIIQSFSKQERIIFVSAFVLAILSSFTLLEAYLQKSLKIMPVAGGEFAEGMVGQPVDINPVTSKSETDQTLMHLMFNNLSSLASSIKPNDNYQIWTVRLKDGLKWQDGEKLVSDDVIFTIEKIQDPESLSPLFSSWQGVSANRLSELEIQFVLSSPYVFFDSNLESLYILPKHLYGDVPVANWRLSDYNLKPIGSGPYKFVSLSKEPNGFITNYYLEADDRYFGKKPLIQYLNFHFFPNRTELIKSFNSDAIDGLGVSSGELGEIKRPYQLFNFKIPTYYAVFFNQNINLALKDLVVRQALNLAIDRKEVVDNVFGAPPTPGLAVPQNFPLPSFIYNFSPSTTTLYIEGVNGLLDANGWKLNDQGIREKMINGTKVDLEFNLIIPDIPFLKQTAGILKSEWSKIGAQVDPIIVSPQEIDQVIKYRNYQSLLFGNSLNPPEDLFAFWHSSQINYPGFNLALYSNKTVDNLIEKIRQETDQEKRDAMLSELQNDIISDQPAVFLYSPYYLYATRKGVGGIEERLILDPTDRFDSVSEWYVKKAISF